MGRWRLLAIEGFEVDVPDTEANAAEFGYAGSGENRSAFPKARVVAVSECGTHAFLAAEVGAWRIGEKTLAARLYPRVRADEVLTSDRNFSSWDAGDTATAPGAVLLWRAPTQLDLPVLRVLDDGSYLTALIKPTIRRARRGDRLPTHLALFATLLLPTRRERTCPRAIKRARHNSHRIKKPGEPASTHHPTPATISLRKLIPRTA